MCPYFTTCCFLAFSPLVCFRGLFQCDVFLDSSDGLVYRILFSVIGYLLPVFHVEPVYSALQEVAWIKTIPPNNQTILNEWTHKMEEVLTQLTLLNQITFCLRHFLSWLEKSIGRLLQLKNIFFTNILDLVHFFCESTTVDIFRWMSV